MLFRSEQSLFELADETISTQMQTRIAAYEQQIDHTLEQALTAVFQQLALLNV